MDELAGAAAALGRVGQAPHLPPVPRAREHARALEPQPVVDRRDQLERLLGREQPQARLARRPRQARVLAREVDLGRHRGQAVAEAAVDLVVRGPEVRDRLAALVDVVELGAHQRAEQAAAAVRRQDADDGHARGADGSPARDGELERERAAARDDEPVLARDVHPLGRQDAREPLAHALVRAAAEVAEDRSERGRELARIGAGGDLGHAAEANRLRGGPRR